MTIVTVANNNSKACRRPRPGPTESVACATPGFYAALCEHGWPGNVRELNHVIFQLAAMIQTKPLDPDHLPGQPCGENPTDPWRENRLP